MSDQQSDLSPFDPYNLYTDEHQAVLNSTTALCEAQQRVRRLALTLAYDKQPPSEEDAVWLIRMAYNALGNLEATLRYEEHRTQQCQEASQPFRSENLPEWLSLPLEEV